MKLFARQQWRYKHREQIYGHGAGVGEEGEGGVYGKSNMETYTLPYVKQTTNGNLLYDSENSNQGSVTT